MPMLSESTTAFAEGRQSSRAGWHDGPSHRVRVKSALAAAEGKHGKQRLIDTRRDCPEPKLRLGSGSVTIDLDLTMMSSRTT